MQPIETRRLFHLARLLIAFFAHRYVLTYKFIKDILYRQCRSKSVCVSDPSDECFGNKKPVSMNRILSVNFPYFESGLGPVGVQVENEMDLL